MRNENVTADPSTSPPFERYGPDIILRQSSTDDISAPKWGRRAVSGDAERTKRFSGINSFRATRR